MGVSRNSPKTHFGTPVNVGSLHIDNATPYSSITAGFSGSLFTSPGVRYNENTSIWEFSNDGLNWYPLGSGSGAGGGSGSCCKLGVPSDGTYTDGILPFTSDTYVRDAIDAINELLLGIAPPPPSDLSGALINNRTIYSGKIATSPLGLIDYSAGDLAEIIFDNSLTLTAPNSTKFGPADKGNLDAVVDGTKVDSFNLLGAFNEAERDGSQSYPPATGTNNIIKVLSVAKYNNFPLWQKGSALIQSGSLSGGEHNFQMQHDTGTIAATSTTQIFYDPETGRPENIITPEIVENSAVIKWLSGIQFYTLGSTFNISGSCSKVFEYTYIDNPIRISLPGFSTLYLPFTDASISGVTTPIPSWDDTLSITNKILTLNAANQSNIDSRVTILPRDPRGNGISKSSIQENRLIDTYGILSTATREYFVDEHYRLPQGTYDSIPSTITGQWDSTSALTNGNAQVISSSLIYPVTNFSSGYLPTQQAGTDYSGFTGNQFYYRAIYDAGTPHFEGTLKFTGITWNDLGTNVKIELKLPTQTGWLDLSTGFSAATYTGADGDGAVVNHSQSGNILTIDWTCGTDSTAHSGYMYILKITFLNSAKNLSEIYEVNF